MMRHFTTLFTARGCDLLKFSMILRSICSGKMGLVGFAYTLAYLDISKIYFSNCKNFHKLEE